jgi:hypothetical protein
MPGFAVQTSGRVVVRVNVIVPSSTLTRPMIHRVVPCCRRCRVSTESNSPEPPTPHLVGQTVKHPVPRRHVAVDGIVPPEAGSLMVQGHRDFRTMIGEVSAKLEKGTE